MEAFPAQDAKLGRRQGFGMTIDIINGGEECRDQDPKGKMNREDRIGFYRYFASLLNVSVDKDCDCAGMATY